MHSYSTHTKHRLKFILVIYHNILPINDFVFHGTCQTPAP